MEVVAQKAEAGPCERRRQHRRPAAIQREREDRERRCRDRADAGLRPSMPSMKFKLFISATIQSMVTGYSSAPRSSAPTAAGDVVDRGAGGDGDRGRRELAHELDDRLISKRSSSRPTARARRRRAGSRARGPPSDGCSSSTGIATAMNIAIPPPNGFGFRVQAPVRAAMVDQAEPWSRHLAAIGVSQSASNAPPVRTRRARRGGPASRTRLHVSTLAHRSPPSGPHRADAEQRASRAAAPSAAA